MISKSSLKALGGFICILVLSLYTYVPGYDKPAALFWDENFHIASAQRYLNGVFFLEPHPPLGKILIAAGEALVGANQRNDQFISVEKASELPDGFSFAGYRLFPVLCAALIAPLLYIALYLLTGSTLAALLTGILPALDNALIVHNRGAMLEAPQLILILLTLIAYLKARQTKSSSLKWFVILGISCAGAMSIKINSAPVLLFPIALLIEERRFFQWLVRFLIPCVLTYLFFWQMHFFIARKVEPILDDKGLFGVSKSFEKIVISGDSWKPWHLIQAIGESYHFTARYQRGVPELEYCKEDENGSTPLLWPLGSRTINYRWEDSQVGTKYLYLSANPAAWGAGIIGVLSALSLVALRMFGIFRASINQRALILLLLAYFISWLSPLLLPRVFYLYHYFVPLIFSWILFGITVSYIPDKYHNLILGVTSALVTVCFLWFKPLTYYEPLTSSELKDRAWLWIWDIRCKDCKSNFLSSCVGVGKNSVRTDPSWDLILADIHANHIEQSVGTPLQTDNTLEVVTRSKIQFPINKKIARLVGTARIAPDNHEQEVEFRIIADGKIIWSTILNKNLKSQEVFDVSLSAYSVLILSAKNVSEDDNSSSVMWDKLEITKSDP